MTRKKLISILGSVGGGVLTIIGIIVIFFPNAFNIEVKKIKKLELDLINESSIIRLDDFLEKHKEEIVNLEISVCQDLDLKCPSIDIEPDLNDINDSNDSNDSNFLNVRAYISDENGETICESDYFSTGVSFYFDKEHWGWYGHEGCINSDSMGVYKMSGYFLVPKLAGYGQGWTEWMLTSIPEREIKLKSY